MKRSLTVWVLADQLTPNHPAIQAAELEVGRDGFQAVLVESRSWMRRLPYHKKRQVLYLSAGRHFVDELKGLGYSVDLIRAEDSREGLMTHIKRHQPERILTTLAAEYAPRRWQTTSMSDDLGIPVEVKPDTLFLVNRFSPIPEPERGKRYVMENFYRSMRKHFGLLMEPGGKPTGGKWNLDAENRKRLPKGYVAPRAQGFPPDAVTQKVMKEVELEGFGVGSTTGFDLAVTRDQANAAFADFLEHRLADFGPYEDAMSLEDSVLHHSILSPQMNLGLLDPLDMVRAAELEYRAGRVPLNSAEGFIRQIIGWREFMYWQYHRQMPELRASNGWDAHRGMPTMFWDARTDMRCIRSVVERLIDAGHTHHIERLMIVCNFCLLAGIDPAVVADWFLTFYIDSHDWVVLPNVIGMGLNADGGITATKPYIASAAYIHNMSNFCEDCRFSPAIKVGKEACPYNFLYWNFLIDHESTLRSNPRLGPAVLGLKHLKGDDREQIQFEARQFLDGMEIYGISDVPLVRT